MGGIIAISHDGAIISIHHHMWGVCVCIEDKWINLLFHRLPDNMEQQMDLMGEDCASYRDPGFFISKHLSVLFPMEKGEYDILYTERR